MVRVFCTSSSIAFLENLGGVILYKLKDVILILTPEVWTLPPAAINRTDLHQRTISMFNTPTCHPQGWVRVFKISHFSIICKRVQAVRMKFEFIFHAMNQEIKTNLVYSLYAFLLSKNGLMFNWYSNVHVVTTLNLVKSWDSQFSKKNIKNTVFSIFCYSM